MKMHRSIGRLGALALVLSAVLAGCGGPLRFAPHGTPKAPDAEAVIMADVNQSSAITKLQITTEHLAPPDRLGDGGTTFVVWAKKVDGKEWNRVGALKYDADKRTGTLEDASVPLTSFDLAITVETQPAPSTPSPTIVVFQKIAE
jgi:hypothetical protein